MQIQGIRSELRA
uniref:Uncharacterized protein n=1 Tax=Anguilla anguilla TaxID=7936 RepID=A0A0E9QJS0_ANGAN